jgi:hypothetical protein
MQNTIDNGSNKNSQVTCIISESIHVPNFMNTGLPLKPTSYKAKVDTTADKNKQEQLIN